MSVFIIGVPTAGKSTLTRRIKQELKNINIVSFEAVRNGFIKVMPDLKMEDRRSEARKEILPEFLMECARWNEKLTGDLSVVEGSFCSGKAISELARDGDLVICLGYGGNKTKEEIARMALSRVQPGHYLYDCSMEKFVHHFYDIDEEDRRNLAACKKYEIPYYNVFDGKDDFYAEIFNKIRVLLKEGQISRLDI